MDFGPAGRGQVRKNDDDSGVSGAYIASVVAFVVLFAWAIGMTVMLMLTSRGWSYDSKTKTVTLRRALRIKPKSRTRGAGSKSSKDSDATDSDDELCDAKAPAALEIVLPESKDSKKRKKGTGTDTTSTPDTTDTTDSPAANMRLFAKKTSPKKDAKKTARYVGLRILGKVYSSGQHEPPKSTLIYTNGGRVGAHVKNAYAQPIRVERSLAEKALASSCMNMDPGGGTNSADAGSCPFW